MKKIFTLLAILVTFLGMGQTYTIDYNIVNSTSGNERYFNNLGLPNQSCTGGTLIGQLNGNGNYVWLSNTNVTPGSGFCSIPTPTAINYARSTQWMLLVGTPRTAEVWNGLNIIQGTYRYSETQVITFGDIVLSTPDFEKSFSVYPNPTRDVVNIDLESEVSGEVYNLTGSLVLNFTSHEVDLSTLQPGVYLMKIFSEGMQCTKKIVKQ